MSLFSFGGGANKGADKAAREAAAQRAAEWDQALARDQLPSFVESRLADARAGKTPWVSTLSSAELLLAITRGVRPIATVVGTCWQQFGVSWTEGHAAGWESAQHRLRAEALACGANAVVDVKMRTIQNGAEAGSMDFSLIGTAVKVQGLSASTDPIIATVPLMAFIRLMQAGVVPVGLAIGVQHDWLVDPAKSFGGAWSWNNQELSTLSRFWETLRRRTHAQLKADAARHGNGVLAHTELSQFIKQEGDKAPDRYLGRHLVLGTLVQSGEASVITRDIQTVVDMCDGPSPLDLKLGGGAHFYGLNEREGGI